MSSKHFVNVAAKSWWQFLRPLTADHNSNEKIFHSIRADHATPRLQESEKGKARAGRATSNVFAKMSKKLMQEMKEVGCVDGDCVSSVFCHLWSPSVSSRQLRPNRMSLRGLSARPPTSLPCFVRHKCRSSKRSERL